MPKCIDLLRQCTFRRIPFLEIFTHAQEALHQKSAFDKVAPVIFRAERLYFSGLSVYPVRPDTVKPVGTRQIIDDTVKPSDTRIARDKSPLNGD